jgi:DNA gyrase subunit A
MGKEGIRNAYTTGKGKVVIRAKTVEENLKGGRKQIVVTELPYQVNKAALAERIADLVKNKKIAGISEIRDESDRHGMRLVIELKRDAQYQRVLNNIYNTTPMQSTFFINMVVLVAGQPRLVNLKEALTCYIDFRHEVLTRRSQFELTKAQNREHILQGFIMALDNMDEVIKTIRASETVEDARNNLMTTFSFSQIQAQAILDMPLRRLAHLERQKIIDEHEEILKTIAYLEDLLANPRKIRFLIQEDVKQLQAKYGDKRRSVINTEEIREFQQEELIPHEQVVITLSQNGFIKRMSSSTYRQQGRGGKGVQGMVTREGDVINHILSADTHDNILFFSQRGKVYSLKCYDIPESMSRTTKGTAIVNIIPIDLKDEVTAILRIKDFLPDQFLLMATKNGLIKKTSLARFSAIRRNGVIAMGLRANDSLVSTKVVDNSNEVVLVTRKGRAIRFAVEGLRTASRTSGGVRGIRVVDDQLVSMDAIFPQYYLLTVTEKGYGKVSAADHYPKHGRGGKGIQTHKVNEKTGFIAAARMVAKDEKDLILSSKEGKVVRIPIAEISAKGRRTMGLRVMSLNEGDVVVAITTQSVKSQQSLL